MWKNKINWTSPNTIGIYKEEGVHHRQLQTRAYQGSCPGMDRLNHGLSSTLTYIVILLSRFSRFSAWVNIQVCSHLWGTHIQNTQLCLKSLGKLMLWQIVADNYWAQHYIVWVLSQLATYSCGLGMRLAQHEPTLKLNLHQTGHITLHTSESSWLM